MARYILDSDAVVDQLNGIEASIQALGQIISEGHLLCSCEVMLAEVYSGLSRERAVKAVPFLESLTFLPSAPEIGMQAGIWRYTYARQGIQIAITDALIAATALVHNATLISGNVRHYPMPELRVLPLPPRRV